MGFEVNINPLNAELNHICRLLALLGGATIVVVSRLKVKEVIWEAMNWIHLAWDREEWRDFVKTRMSLRFPRNLGNFLTRTGTNRSSRMTVLQGVG
jgi:hypothetical protein